MKTIFKLGLPVLAVAAGAAAVFAPQGFNKAFAQGAAPVDPLRYLPGS